MGSPIFTVVANTVMEEIESQALTTSPVNYIFWKRYVDGVICAVPEDEVDDMLTHINSVHESIQFMCEQETDASISFLDVKISRQHNGSLSTCTYRKPTHQVRYLLQLQAF